MIKFKDYKHVTPVQIRFTDIDRLNHVNNACYLTYCELGRIKYFAEVFGTLIDWNKKGLILARTEIDHLAPLFLHDDIYCFTKITVIGNKSLSIKNVIIKKTEDELKECASVLSVLVAMDYTTNTSIEIPQSWRDLINKFEK